MRDNEMRQEKLSGPGGGLSVADFTSYATVGDRVGGFLPVGGGGSVAQDS